MFYRTLLIACTCAIMSSGASALTSGDIEGIVSDANREPLSQAAVFVYSARLKKGYATVCPTCWVDCGKSALTDRQGRFVLHELDGKLKFRLLIVKGGYVSGEVRGADPAANVPVVVKLSPRPAASDPNMLLQGRVTDRAGIPVSGALIEPTGATASDSNFLFGSPPGLEALTVSDQTGAFELVSQQPYKSIVLMISPRGYAPEISTEEMGLGQREIQVSTGATVMGRLVRRDGAPIANAEVGLSPLNSSNGQYFRPERVGTDSRGVFVFSNVPAHHVWRVYPTESLATLNLTAKPVWCEVARDGETVNLGKYVLTPGLKLAGHVRRAHGTEGLGTGLTVSLEDLFAGGNNRIAEVSADGRFEFRDLPSGPYNLTLASPGHTQRPTPPSDVLLEHDREDVLLELP